MIEASNIQISSAVLSLIAEIDEFKGAWRALGTLAPERLSALRWVATIESIGSSTRIEGSQLSDREVERLLANLEIQSFASRDEQEVAGYAAVMETLFHAWQFAGIFDSREKALAWCRDRTYFISQVPLNVGAPHETEAFPGFWYPLAGGPARPHFNCRCQL